VHQISRDDAVPARPNRSHGEESDSAGDLPKQTIGATGLPRHLLASFAATVRLLLQWLRSNRDRAPWPGRLPSGHTLQSIPIAHRRASVSIPIAFSPTRLGSQDMHGQPSKEIPAIGGRPAAIPKRITFVLFVGLSRSE